MIAARRFLIRDKMFVITGRSLVMLEDVRDFEYEFCDVGQGADGFR